MIVILNENNLNDLYNIEDNCFSHPMSKQNLLDSLTNDKYFVFKFHDVPPMQVFLVKFSVFDYD